MSTMRAVYYDTPGGPDVLKVREEPIPQPAAGEVLVRVAAAGVNGADLNLRSGRSKSADASGRPGLEVFGHVVNDGEGFKAGDTVCALVAGGGYAEYVVVPAVQCLPPPAGLGAPEAGGIIETAATVWDNVFERGRLVKGETLLVHGGASGIGTTAIQLAHARGIRVFATAGSKDKCGIAEALGAERCFNYRDEDFVAPIVKAGGVDVILDVAGASYLARNLEMLRMDGRIVVIAVNTGAEATLDLRAVMSKRAVITGSMLKTRTPAQKQALLKRVCEEMWPLYASGRMKVIVGKVLPLDRAAEAHAAMESGATHGKVILVP